MNVIVNDQEVVLDEACTVRQLLDRHGLGGAVCAVEVNRKLVFKRHHDQHVLNDGDRVEIVTLVGGG